MKTYPMRARIRNDGTGPARVDIYDDIGQGGWLSGGYTPASFAEAIKGVSGPLDVHINSAGGDVGDGIAIASAIRAYPGPKRTIVDGMAASIASVIAQAGDERIVEPGAMLMIHDPFTRTEGNAGELRKTADALDKHGDNLARQYADRSGTKSAGQWRDVMRAEAWFDAGDAVREGLADRVGSGAAQLPQGVDLDALAAHAPGRIMAALRSMPQAAAGARHEPITGTHSHPHPAYGSQGGDAMHSHEHTHNGDASHQHSHGDDSGDSGDGDNLPFPGAAPPFKKGGNRSGHALAATGKPYEPGPYHRDPDETVECPVCHLFNDTDAKFCDQCGTKLAGRDDVREIPAGPSARGERLQNAAGDEQLGSGWVRGADGTVRFDPDGDGDDDSTPEGDTDHDYFSEDGQQVKPVPPCPVARDALTEARMRAIIREEVARAAAAAVDNSPWDASKAWHGGMTADDPAAFYKAICAGEKTSGDPATQAHWALPYRYTPDSPPNAAAVRNCLARLSQTQDLKDPQGTEKKLQGLMKDINPDYEPAGNSTDRSIFAADAVKRYRAALKGARA